MKLAFSLLFQAQQNNTDLRTSMINEVKSIITIYKDKNFHFCCGYGIIESLIGNKLITDLLSPHYYMKDAQGVHAFEKKLILTDDDIPEQESKINVHKIGQFYIEIFTFKLVKWKKIITINGTALIQRKK